MSIHSMLLRQSWRATSSMVTGRIGVGLRRGMAGGKMKGYDVLGDGIEGEEMRSAIRGIGDTSFLVNNVEVNQSVLLFPHSFLMWNATTLEDITIDNLTPFTLFYPTIEILFIGCGKNAPEPPRLAPEIHAHFREQGVMLEVTTTEHAASTFNILNSEGRNVGAALLTHLPPEEAFKGKPLLGSRRVESLPLLG